MRSILSVILTAALLLGGLTACARNRAGRVEEARTTPTPPTAATARPAATAAPEANMGDAAKRVGDRIGGAVERAGDAVGDMVSGAGEAVNDLVGDGETEEDGMNGAAPDTTAAP